MIIEEKAKHQIELMRNKCEKNGLLLTKLIKKDYNFEFAVEKGKEAVKIQVYFGKKGIKTILQGNLKSDLYASVSSLITDEPTLTFRDTPLNEPNEYIGTDECGKGDFFGPLIAAAVYVNPETKKKLLQLGVRDSKDLSEYQITHLSKLILEVVKNDFEIVQINPAKYNEVYEKFSNLNKLLNWAHSKAIEKLLDKVDCDCVITDKFSKSNLQISSSSKHSNVDFIQEEKAEKYVGVAAASILARNSFNEWFNNLAKHGLKLPKGSSNVEVFAAALLKKIGEEKFAAVAKLHFKTFSRIRK